MEIANKLTICREEIENLLNKLCVDYREIEVGMYVDSKDLVRAKKGFAHFQEAFEVDNMFKDTVGGYRIARIYPYIFMYKMYKNVLLYVEVDLK